MIIKKGLNLILLAILFLIAISTTLYYKLICSTGVCTYDLIMNTISPIEYGGYVIASFFFIFLFLPSKYFTSWLKYIFSWGLPLSVFLVETMHSETDWLVISKADVVRLLGLVFGVVTILFVISYYLLHRK